MPKATHTINAATGDLLGGAPSFVYGPKDLARRVAAAKQTATPVTVRKVGKEER